MTGVTDLLHDMLRNKHRHDESIHALTLFIQQEQANDTRLFRHLTEHLHIRLKEHVRNCDGIIMPDDLTLVKLMTEIRLLEELDALTDIESFATSSNGRVQVQP